MISQFPQDASRLFKCWHQLLERIVQGPKRLFDPLKGFLRLLFLIRHAEILGRLKSRRTYSLAIRQTFRTLLFTTGTPPCS